MPMVPTTAPTICAVCSSVRLDGGNAQHVRSPLTHLLLSEVRRQPTAEHDAPCDDAVVGLDGRHAVPFTPSVKPALHTHTHVSVHRSVAAGSSQLVAIVCTGEDSAGVAEAEGVIDPATDMDPDGDIDGWRTLTEAETLGLAVGDGVGHAG